MRCHSPSHNGTDTDTICSHYRSREQVLGSRCYISTFGFTGRLERPSYGSRLGPGPTGQDFKDSRGVYAVTPQTEIADQSVIQGTFLLFHLWARVLFDSSASHSFIVALCVKKLGLEVETLEKSLHVSSPLGTSVRIDKICQDCELEISGILLTVDLRVINMSKFDVIIGMDRLTAHRVIIDCDRRRVTAYT